MQHIREAALSHELGSGEQESFWVVEGVSNRAAFCRSEAASMDVVPASGMSSYQGRAGIGHLCLDSEALGKVVTKIWGSPGNPGFPFLGR